MSSHNQLILFDTGKSSDLLNSGSREAFLSKRRNERCIFKPEAESIREDFETRIGIERAELGRNGRRGWSKRLVDLLFGRRGVGDESGENGSGGGFALGFVRGSEMGGWGEEERGG